MEISELKDGKVTITLAQEEIPWIVTCAQKGYQELFRENEEFGIVHQFYRWLGSEYYRAVGKGPIVRAPK